MRVSWIPYKYCISRVTLRGETVLVNLNKIGIPIEEQFVFYSSDKGFSLHLRAFGFREPLNWKHYYDSICKDDVVLDIGANLGMFTLLSRNARRIICIEPLTEAVEILSANLEKWRLLGKTEIINMAISDSNESVVMHVNESLNLSKVISCSYPTNHRERSIEARTLGEYVRKYNANVLRMDLEGYEYEVLMNRIPKRVTKVALEYHARTLGRKKSLKLLEYFQAEQFKVRFMIEDLPLRLYPFYQHLRVTGLLRFFTYVKRDADPLDCASLMFKGRNLKYLILGREKKK